MSSLKDIMDVDVEPLESQAYRRSREAAQHQASSRPSIAPSSETPSPSIDDDDDNNNNNKRKGPVKRRRSNRVSKTATLPTSTRSNVPRRRSSASGEAMDYTSGYQTAGSNQASTSGTPQQGSRASDSGAEIPVKYTPVTGRISRAKKGVPVHTCEICRPAKTFTRAEHLRRHQLSHQKPAFACTFEDCERAFHRPDLLARHMHRHETQGEKPYKAGDRSRASSSASESRTPSLKVETPSQGGLILNQISPTESSTPRTSASGDSTMTTTSFGTVVPNFQPVNYSPGSSAQSHKRSASQAQLPESDSYVAPSPGSNRQSVSFDQMTSGTFSGRNMTEMPNQNNFSRPGPSGFEDMNFEGGDAQFPNYTTTPQLPLLRIPEETYIPSLSYTQDNSPWCSSASDSTFSNHSDGSRNGRHWPRGRSGSLADWPVSAGPTQWSPHGITTTPQDLRSPPFDPSILDQYETPYTSPRMTPSSSRNQLLDVPNSYGGYSYMESVGTPALSTYSKPIAQLFSASSSRVSDPGLVGINAPGPKTQLGRLSAPTPLTSNHQTQPQLNNYLTSYWQHFHSIFPIVHRPTFHPTDDNQILTYALAAIGTQYHPIPEARKTGSELNELCRRAIDICPNWNLQTMQAIFLTEIFTLFRGRKSIVRLSKPFEELYRRLLEGSGQDFKPPLSSSPGSAPSADVLLDRYGTQANTQVQQTQDLQSEWLQWIEDETRKRLLSACFVFDVHQAIYHQQPRSKASRNDPGPFSLPCSQTIWGASTAPEWQAQQSQSGYAPQQLQFAELDLSTESSFGGNPFSQSLLISFYASRLPTREDPAYSGDSQLVHSGVASLMTFFPTSPLAQSYLALSYTPLQDLLAIAGDTWIFGKKITPPSAFHNASNRLKAWSSSPAAAQATLHACRVLSLSLTGQTNGVECITDYWGLYVAVLICWAFGHRFQTSAGGSGSISRNSSSEALNAMDVEEAHQPTDEARLKALAYIDGMLALDVKDLLQKNTASLKGDTSGVIAAIRQRLERDSVGGACSMLVDCIGVLSKISKTGKGNWF